MRTTRGRQPLTLSRLRDMTTQQLIRKIEECQEHLLRDHFVDEQLPEPNALEFLYVAELTRRNAQARQREDE